MLKTEKDEEFRAMAKEELNELNEAQHKLEEDVRLMLIPEDPQDNKNCIVEIRAVPEVMKPVFLPAICIVCI